MKVQLKLDKDSLQEFFLEHTEKILFGIVVLGFLAITYQAAVRKGYDKQPENLKRDAQAAEQNISKKLDFRPETEFNPPPPDSYWKIVEGVRKPIIVTFENRQNYFAVSRPPTVSRRVRGAPLLCQIKELRAASGRGQVAATDGGGAKEQGLRWIVITGLVPWREQTDQFETCFEGAQYHPDSDKEVKYEGFYVQRVEIEPGASGNLDWSKAKVFEVTQDAGGKWEAKKGSELADPRLVRPALCAPLPPVLDREWGKEVVHPPEIPIMVIEEKAGTPGRGPKVTPRPPQHGRRTEAGESEPSTGAKPSQEEPKTPKYLLFRIFDTEVEPGKQYCYRVFVKVKNPNSGVDTKFLDADARNTVGQEFLNITPEELTAGCPDIANMWSKPVGPIPVAGDVRVAGVVQVAKPAPQQGKAPGVSINKWDETQGQDVTAEFPVARGGGLDFRNVPKHGRKYDFITGEVVLDCEGADKLPGLKDIIRPVRVVALDRFGNVVLHEEEEKAASPEPEPEEEPKPPAKEPSAKEKATHKPAPKGKTKSKGDLMDDPMFKP